MADPAFSREGEWPKRRRKQEKRYKKRSRSRSTRRRKHGVAGKIWRQNFQLLRTSTSLRRRGMGWSMSGILVIGGTFLRGRSISTTRTARDEASTVQRTNVVHSFIKTMGWSASNRTELLSCLHQSIVEYYTIEDLQLWLRRPNPPPPDSTFYQAVFRTRIVLNELGDIMSIEYASEGDRKLLGQGLGLHSPDQDGAE